MAVCFGSVRAAIVACNTRHVAYALRFVPDGSSGSLVSDGSDIDGPALSPPLTRQQCNSASVLCPEGLELHRECQGYGAGMAASVQHVESFVFVF